jgi:hypothetical protein
LDKLDNPKFTKVFALAEEYVLNFDKDRDSEYDTEYIFEEVLKAIYGDDVFERLYNKD